MDNSQSISYMSNYEAYGILKSHKSRKYPAIKDICNRCNIPKNTVTSQRLYRKFCKLLKDRIHARKIRSLHKWTSDSRIEEFCKYLPCSNEIIEDREKDCDSDYVVTPPKRGRQHMYTKQPLSANLHRSTIEKRVDAVLPSFESIAECENTSLVQLLLITLVRVCKRLGWTSLAKILYSVFIGMSDIDQCKNAMSIEKSAFLMISHELGRDRYQDLRSTLMCEGLEAQPWHLVNDHCNSITPERIPVNIDPSDGVIGYRFEFEQVCTYIVNRALLAANIDVANVPTHIYIGGKDGTDGSGQHYRRAQVHVAVKGNIILYSFTPLIICTGNDATGTVLWQNPVPNSALTQRPLAIVGAKEDRDDVLRPLIPQIETGIAHVSEHGVNMVFMGISIHVTVHSSLAMFDGKMHSSLQGTGGAYCQMCRYSKADCHSKEHAITGFPVDRTIEDMHAIFSMLSDDGQVPVSKKEGDYGTRAGVTAEPITHRNLNTGLSVTHAWICSCSWFLNILYHVVANDKTWGFGHKTSARYKHLMKAKSRVQDTFATVLGIKIDTADGTGHSGNSLNGKISKRCHAEECRKLLSNLVKPAQLDVMQTLHKNMYVILRIISSKDHKIDIAKLRNLCTETYVHILEHLKWVDLTPTVHKVLAHAPELIEKNLCMGVGNLSEEGLEACHKIIRRFRTSWTLQTSDDANMKDLIKKMWLVSDPLFYSYRRIIKCSKCGSTGHQRKCPLVQGFKIKQ